MLLLTSHAAALSKETLRQKRLSICHLSIVVPVNPEINWLFLLFGGIYSKFCDGGMSCYMVNHISNWLLGQAGKNSCGAVHNGDSHHTVPSTPGVDDGDLLASEYLLKGAGFYLYSVIRESFCSHNSVASNKTEANTQLWIKTAWFVGLLES